MLKGSMQAAVEHSSRGFVEGGAAVEALTNAVEGVGVMIGVPAPQVRLIPSDSANAMVAASPHAATLVVTTALINESGPAELEAVAAELLCRVRDGSAEYLTLCAAIPDPLKGLTGASAPAVAAVLGEQRSARADLEAIAVTRYPPALISTLERMAKSGTEVAGARPETAPLWLAPAIPGSQDGSSVLGTAIQPISYRTALLREL
jgi:Zn-dependent protease with chaperone function